MTQIIADCPYCKTKNIAMHIFGSQDISFNDTYISALCRCKSAILFAAKKHIPNEFWQGSAFDASTIEATICYPPSDEIDVPLHLPENVREAYCKGKKLQNMQGFEEEAATNFRKALEHTIKATHPEVYQPQKNEKINLYTAIERLANQQLITQSLKNLAHGIRLIGNEATYGDRKNTTTEEVSEIADFTEAFLTYLISLPQELHLRFPDRPDFQSPLISERKE